MRKILIALCGIVLLAGLGACAPIDPDRYNTQKGALGGAAAGALAGQAIGRDTESTLIGAGVGALIGALAGNAVDQHNVAVRQAARTGGRVVYLDGRGGMVEATPIGPVNQRTNCRKVRKTIWKDGKLVGSETEEICEAEKTEPHYLNN